MAFASLTANLNLNIANFSSRLATASQQINTFATRLNDNYGRANAALHKHSLGLKDTARIVQGIMVSQAFYGLAQSIRSAADSLIAFNEQLDYAQVTYSALFGDSAKAANFTKVLQEHSVNTIFDYSQLAAASKKMLAYGIEYENLMYVMEGLTNLGAMSGDVAAMDRIALALGQIQTTGYLAATEMRQLANAYVPIYDIVQESFGLSGEQMKDVGALKLPAYQVINAIVDYANAKFGEVGDAAMMTITGLKNRIVDTMKVMGSEMFMPLTVAWKSFLVYVSKSLSEIRKVYQAGGWGGLFEMLVPDAATQTTVRAFFANLHNLIMTIISSLSSVLSILGVLGETFMITFNLVAPVIMGVVNALAATLRALTQNEHAASALRTALVLAAGAFAVLKIQAIAATIITAVTSAVIGLSKALMLLAAIVVKHPVLMLIAGIGIALTGLAASSNNANNSLSKLFKNISGFGGVTDQEDIFKKIENGASGAAGSIDDLNNRLTAGSGTADDMAEGVEGIGGAADKAKKKISGLLSFDEVFKLPDPKEDSASSGGSYSPYAGLLEDLAAFTSGFGGLGDAILGDIPDFREYIDKFTEGLFGGLEDGIVDKLKDTAIGALLGAGIGAIIGGLLGGPGGALLGAKIGAAAGAIIGLFWDKIKETFGFTDTSAIASLVPGALGMALGFNAFGVPGALLGGAIGVLAGNLVSMLWTKLAEALGRSDSEAEFSVIASSLGTGIGAIIGFVLGGPAGALIGGAIGTLAGGLLGMFKDSIVEVFKSFDIADAIAGAMSGMLLGMSTGNPLFALLSALGGFVIGGFFEGIDEALADLGTWIKEHIFDPFVTWFCNLFGIESPSTVMHEFGMYLIQGLLNGLVDNWPSISEWLVTTKDNFNLWWDEVKAAWQLKWDAITLEMTTWLDTTKTNWLDRYATIKSDVSAWWDGLKTDYSIKQEELLSELNTWLSDKFTAWSNKYEELKTFLTEWWTLLKEDTNIYFEDLRTIVTDKLGEVKQTWVDKWAEIKTEFSTWWRDLKTDIGNWLEWYVWTPISNFFSIENFWNRIKGLLDAIKEKLAEWWEDATSIFSSVGNIATNIGGAVLTGSRYVGHADGGVFNREHIARFAEGNKAEAIIPLENASAMQPFVDAVANGIIQGLLPVMASTGSNQSSLPPMYVGTLVADDRGLRQLYHKFEIIEAQEAARKGFA